MRELKFRVWNNRYNEFVRPDYGLIGICYPLDGSISTLTTNGEPMEDCTLEQYTGLKDKNGKEIYEGDIIQTDRGARAIGWNNEYARFGIHETREGFYCFCKLSNFEIIGNIHENPELLERKDAKN